MYKRIVGKTVSKVKVQLPAVDRVYCEIKKRICRGEYLPGMHLIEADLTKEFNVSRVTIRDGLRLLVTDELVELIPYRGIRVRKLSYKDLMDIYALREYIEALAARLAAGQPKETLKPIQDAFLESERMLEANDIRRYTELNSIFHSAIAMASGNAKLVFILERMNTSLVVFQFMAYFKRVSDKQTQKDHKEILIAIMAGNDEQAESLMRRHILYNKNMIEQEYSSNSLY